MTDAHTVAPNWRTLIDPQITASYGCGELLAVFYQPREDTGGTQPSVVITIHETMRQQISAALRIAHQQRSRVVIITDTREQADRIAARATELLPTHRRIAYERAEAGQYGGLA
jgi:hypothetical protein